MLCHGKKTTTKKNHLHVTTLHNNPKTIQAVTSKTAAKFAKMHLPCHCQQFQLWLYNSADDFLLPSVWLFRYTPTWPIVPGDLGFLHPVTRRGGGGWILPHGSTQTGLCEVLSRGQLAVIRQCDSPASSLSAERFPEYAEPYRSPRWKGQRLGPPAGTSPLLRRVGWHPAPTNLCCLTGLAPRAYDSAFFIITSKN